MSAWVTTRTIATLGGYTVQKETLFFIGTRHMNHQVFFSWLHFLLVLWWIGQSWQISQIRSGSPLR